jgi:hypothetical protein
MKDYLGNANWINQFPRNPTQTDLIRFKTNPASPLTSGFKKSRDEWNKFMDGTLKTEMLEKTGWYGGRQ